MRRSDIERTGVSPQGSYLLRLVDRILPRLLTTFPAVLLTGPRATGKTTTALRHADTVLRLDRREEAEAVRAAPDVALSTLSGTVLIDEWQEVPDVLGAVKRAVDAGATRTRFLLTGSVRAPLSTAMWPGTGRILHLRMYPLTVAELTAADTGPQPHTLDLLRSGRAGEVRAPADPPDLLGYLELAMQSGYPSVASLADADRRMWLRAYLEQVLLRDSELLGEQRDPRRLRRFVETLAANTAGLVTDTEIARAAGVDSRTAARYQRLLEDLGIVDAVPAWFTNRMSRLAKGRKRYLIDPGLAGAVLGVDAAGLLRQGELMGRLLDTFVATQLRPLIDLDDSGARLHHLRQRDGRYEVDLVIEYPDGRVVGLEVKATAGPRGDDARHLAWLRDQLGERFIAGIVLHTGRFAYPLGERILAAPISVLWSPPLP